MRSHLAHRSRRALALLVFVVAAVVPSAGHAADKGLQTDLTWGISSGDQDRTMNGLVDLGARWHRISVAWHDIETRKGSYSSTALNRHDQAITKAAASGINLVVTVHTSPNWASGTTDREAPPTNPADYADFMSFVAARYRGKVQAWEIWNEQNTQRFWPTGPDAAQYARLLKAAYPAVKAADQSALVVYGGTWQNDYAYLEQAYAAVPDLGSYFDALATHPYYGATAPEHAPLGPDGRIPKWAFAGYRELRKTMLDHGDDKPIWFTEFGWSTYDGAWGVSEATQADYLRRAFDCIEQDPYVNVAIVYAFRNLVFGSDGQDWEYQLGLTRTDFSPKASYNVFKAYAPDGGGCEYGQSAPAPVLEPPAAVTDLLLSTTGQLPDSGLAGAAASPTTANAMLGVRRAQVQDGQVIIDARVARGATGEVQGVAAYGDVTRKFSARVGPHGAIAARVPLPAGAKPDAVWIGLAYSGDARFGRQWVFLQAASRRARLRVLPVGSTSGVADSWTVRGRVNPLARGRMALLLTFLAADGSERTKVARPRIRNGVFEHTFRVPRAARESLLHVVFPGDPKRGVGGGSATIRPPVAR